MPGWDGGMWREYDRMITDIVRSPRPGYDGKNLPTDYEPVIMNKVSPIINTPNNNATNLMQSKSSSTKLVLKHLYKNLMITFTETIGDWSYI